MGLFDVFKRKPKPTPKPVEKKPVADRFSVTTPNRTPQQNHDDWQNSPVNPLSSLNTYPAYHIRSPSMLNSDGCKNDSRSQGFFDNSISTPYDCGSSSDTSSCSSSDSSSCSSSD